MRISVFTGPFLLDDDPVRFGVQVPRSFWKVISFIHDETGKLSATGYTMSQEDFLREERLGQHETSQVPISLIEQQTGLSFGDLAPAHDPLRDAEGSAGDDPDGFPADPVLERCRLRESIGSDEPC